MFEWILNTTLNTVTNFFQIKVDDFFFQRLTFPTNTCQRLRRIQNQSEHLRWSFFTKIFFAKFPRTHLCRNHFLIELQVSILQLYCKNRLPSRCFLINFGRYLKNVFYKTPAGDSFCSAEKYFTNKIAKNPLSKFLKKEKRETNSW